MKFLLSEIVGIPCIILLVLLRYIPGFITIPLGMLLLPLYQVLRFSQVLSVKRRIHASPFSGKLGISAYYRARLRILIALVKMHRPRKLPRRLSVRGEEHLQAALEARRPVLLYGLHLGYFELLHKVPMQHIEQQNSRYNVVTAEAFSWIFSRYMDLGRRAPAKKLHSNKKFFSALRRTVKTKQVLGVMADQSPMRGKETLTLWNSLTLPFSVNIAQTVLNNGGVVIPVSTWNSPEGETIFVYHPPLDGLTEGTADVYKCREQVRIFLETEIAKSPDQWNWSYPGLELK